jgi:hypothetical protein
MRNLVVVLLSVTVRATALLSAGRREALVFVGTGWHWLLGTGGLGVAPTTPSGSEEALLCPPSQNVLGLAQRREAQEWLHAPFPNHLAAEHAATQLEMAATELLDLDDWLTNWQWVPKTDKTRNIIDNGDDSGQRTALTRGIAARLASPALLGDGTGDGWFEANPGSSRGGRERSPRSGLALAALTLARADGVPLSVRQDVGWPWGLCGWRHCGPLADAEKALATLAAQSGMLAPSPDMRFLVDVARRSVDEARGVCRAAGLVRGTQPTQTSTAAGTRAGSAGRANQRGAAYDTAYAYAPLPPLRPYLPIEELNAVLGSDEAGGTVMVGGSNEAASAAAMDVYEAEVLAAFQDRRNGGSSVPSPGASHFGSGTRPEQLVGDGAGASAANGLVAGPSGVDADDDEGGSISPAQRALALRLRLAF